MNYQLLVVEDDPDINGVLCTILRKEGYTVHAAFSGSEARLLLEQEAFSLVLLDLMLPGLTGEELLAWLRQSRFMPVIVISAKPQEDKVNALRLGADDFISKPFDVPEVLARVQAQLRRYTRFAPAAPESGRALSCGPLRLDPESATAAVGEAPLSLTPRELKILQLLLAHPRKVFTRANLYESVWGEPFMGDDNTVNVHISNLRAKLSKADPSREYIKTVWGIGFKLADL